MKPVKALELIRESDIKKFIIGGVALFVLNFLLGLATAKAEPEAIPKSNYLQKLSSTDPKITDSSGWPSLK